MNHQLMGHQRMSHTSTPASTDLRVPLRLALNGNDRTLQIRMHDAGLAGTKRACETSDCGACAVLVAGRLVNSCSTLALQVDGQEILTIEGLAGVDAMHPLQEAFLRHAAAQCGFCIPGMILSLHALFSADPAAPRAAVRDVLGLCRCTGYVKPMEAALDYQRSLAERPPHTGGPAATGSDAGHRVATGSDGEGAA
jgi:carbon-monoxide dehydrogenase small subunit